jgi:anti-sigma factor RsiW
MDHDDATPRDLTCRELVAFVLDYLDDALPLPERVAFESHLAGCEDCLVYLRSYRETVRLGKAHGEADDGAAPDMPEDLVQAILAARRGEKD